MKRVKDDDTIRNLKTTFGINVVEDKLVFRHSVINEKARNDINHLDSEHSLALQKSNYVIIESSYEKIKS